MRFLLSVFALLFSTTSLAVPLTWTINNAVFDDGGTLTGSFVYDADTDQFSNVNLVSEGGSAWLFDTEDPRVYTNDFYQTNAYNGYLWDFGDRDPDYNFSLTLLFDTPLTNAGGEIFILNGGEGVEIVGTSFTNGRELALRSATISAVPVPAAVWLFGSALAGLGWLRRKQTA